MMGRGMIVKVQFLYAFDLDKVVPHLTILSARSMAFSI